MIMCFCSRWQASDFFFFFALCRAFGKPLGANEWGVCLLVCACSSLQKAKPKHSSSRRNGSTMLQEQQFRRQLRQQALSLSELQCWSCGWITIRVAGSRRDQSVSVAVMLYLVQFMSRNTTSVQCTCLSLLSELWVCCNCLALLAAL